jgi:hypothetical protein
MTRLLSYENSILWCNRCKIHRYVAALSQHLSYHANLFFSPPGNLFLFVFLLSPAISIQFFLFNSASAALPTPFYVPF